MRQDQYERLQALEEKLCDVLVGEADPDHWPGKDVPPATMDKQTRGDRYWCKKNAVATISLVQRVGALIGQVQLSGNGTAPAEVPEGDGTTELDAEVAAAEKEAEKLLRQVQSGAKKAAFDKRVHGRAA
jgi:hypothetical protein